MKTVSITLNNSKNSSIELPINEIVTLEKSFIDVGNYLHKDSVGVLIHFKHQMVSQLNLTKVSPYVLLFFDEELIYKGATHSVKSTIGSFTIQTQYPYILFVKHPNNLKLHTILSLNFKCDKLIYLSKKYKYLNYVPVPIHLDSSMYDLVDDKEFCTPDERTPLLIATQHGIFPGGNYPGKKDYRNLNGLENQNIAFIGRGYLSDRERFGLIEFFADANTLNQLRDNAITIDLNLWDQHI